MERPVRFFSPPSCEALSFISTAAATELLPNQKSVCHRCYTDKPSASTVAEEGRRTKAGVSVLTVFFQSGGLCTRLLWLCGCCWFTTFVFMTSVFSPRDLLHQLHGCALSFFLFYCTASSGQRAQDRPDVDLSDCVRFPTSPCDCKIFSPPANLFSGSSPCWPTGCLLPDLFSLPFSKNCYINRDSPPKILASKWNQQMWDSCCTCLACGAVSHTFSSVFRFVLCNPVSKSSSFGQLTLVLSGHRLLISSSPHRYMLWC